MTIALYPGSFDPVTMGHLHIAQRASRLFDHLVIGLANQNYKSSLFSLRERKQFLAESFSQLPNCEIAVYSGLTVDFAKECGASVIIRGLRAISDYEYEMQVAAINKYLDEGIETIFLMSHADYSFLSSTMIKQVVSSGGKVSGLVSPAVEMALEKKLNEGKLESVDTL